jgi:hypothetical protein
MLFYRTPDVPHGDRSDRPGEAEATFPQFARQTRDLVQKNLTVG